MHGAICVWNDPDLAQQKLNLRHLKLLFTQVHNTRTCTEIVTVTHVQYQNTLTLIDDRDLSVKYWNPTCRLLLL